jgi:centrosomal protein CEP104
MSNPNQVGQKLKFRIVDFSGEDPEYPATELLSQSPQARGWQSPRFCDWPQFITLQFMAPVVLKQLQFLSHQCKIASKVELYTAYPDLKSPVPNLELKFKKLGYLSLDPNERSGYQSRELKTVYVECPCLYLKIVFQKCHINKYNLFNQVGLIAIGCFGDAISKDKENKGDPNQLKYDKLEYETQFDQNTLERLKDLEDAKAKAIRDENFDEAKRIKEAIERLKHLGAQL